jgi:hypothetical protein
MTTALARVVELNEGAKEIRRHSFELSLRALGATAKSMRAGDTLRGFVEVSSQMQTWCRSLATAVDRVTVLSTQQVRLVSDIVRRARLQECLRLARQGRTPAPGLDLAADICAKELTKARAQLGLLRDALTDGIETLEQLGMMASALSRAALIEASGGSVEQRGELTVISREFSERAEQVSETVRQIISHNRGALP